MWQPVLMINGYILGVLGLIMLIPAAFDILTTGVIWSPFLISSLTVVFFGISFFLANYVKIDNISLKQGYLVTIICWFTVCVFSAIPFWLSKSAESVADAFFEATSGITGTGATIMDDVETLPQSVLIWRSLLNYIGGLGIVIFAVALLPFLGIGGMQIFQHENSDSNEKFMPRFNYIAKRILFVYIFLTGTCIICFSLTGMDWFNAVNYALSAVSTGGFAPKNNSLAYFDNVKIEIVAMIFMLCGALPMTFYILLLRHAQADRNRQVRVFLKTVLTIAALSSGYLYLSSDNSLADALRYGFFTTITLLTTTGLSSCDYLTWGEWAVGFAFLLTLIGGCTGSTCGSIKILRWQVIYAFLRKYLLTAIEPNRVISLKIGEANTSEKVTMSVFVYVFAFFISLALISALLNVCGYDFLTSVAATTACITNVGLGAAEIIGPSGNYAFFSDTVKCILCFAMLLGRLEIITFLVLLTKSFWRS